MRSALRQSVEEYLRGEGRLDLEHLGSDEAKPRTTGEAGVLLLAESLRQTRSFQRRVQSLCVALLCFVFALQAAFFVYGSLTNNFRGWLAVGSGLSLLLIVGQLRRIWIDNVLTELVRQIVDTPRPDSAALLEIVYWGFLAPGSSRRRRQQDREEEALPVPSKHEDKGEQEIPILFVASDPTDAARLRLGKEAREIQERLKGSALRDRFRFHERFAARPVDLIQGLLETHPQIVHFAGHGTRDGALFFENESGQILRVTASALSVLLRLFRNVNCVVLNACYTKEQAKILGKHVEIVIGTPKSIADHHAISFAAGFYLALGHGSSIEHAFEVGRAEALLIGMPEKAAHVLVRQT
ncbi:MAG TPA: CHAT domain-containing protein [Thermoanaerobaculia bacterium]|nr:CHAT domain-containing protein [Thermoanaerobaculia bacterium]